MKKDDIKGEWLRNHIEAENCCGSAEFIKLYGESISFVLVSIFPLIILLK